MTMTEKQKLAKRTALDRILAAFNAENVQLYEAIGWLSYAGVRDAAAEMLREQVAEQTDEPYSWSIADEVIACEECFNDNGQAFEETPEGLAREIGRLLDDDYAKPINLAVYTSWLNTVQPSTEEKGPK